MTSTNSERAVFTVYEAAKMLGISRNAAYQAVKIGEIPCIRIGARILIPKIAIDKMLAGEQHVISPKWRGNG